VWATRHCQHVLDCEREDAELAEAKELSLASFAEEMAHRGRSGRSQDAIFISGDGTPKPAAGRHTDHLTGWILPSSKSELVHGR
jgi:hypothetical protein